MDELNFVSSSLESADDPSADEEPIIVWDARIRKNVELKNNIEFADYLAGGGKLGGNPYGKDKNVKNMDANLNNAEQNRMLSDTNAYLSELLNILAARKEN